jgi:hypothetical protein
MTNRAPWWVWVLLPILVPVVLALAAIGSLLWFLAAVALQIAVWVVWCVRGRYVLVVYSNSPIWQQYFEQQILPAIGARGVVLNWSDRKRWRYSLAVAAFQLFAGSREFNPLALVFQPFAWVRQFRFYRPFQAFKHGRPQEADAMRRELLETLDTIS